MQHNFPFKSHSFAIASKSLERLRFAEVHASFKSLRVLISVALVSRVTIRSTINSSTSVSWTISTSATTYNNTNKIVTTSEHKKKPKLH